MNTEPKIRYRVGMTTNPEERKKDWRRDCSDINGLGLMIEESWHVFSDKYHDREEAQAVETALKNWLCAAGHHGGANPKENKANIGDLLVSNPLPWQVYIFAYWYNPSVVPKFDVNCLPPDFPLTPIAQIQIQEIIKAAQREASANSIANLVNERGGRRGVPANPAASLANRRGGRRGVSANPAASLTNRRGGQRGIPANPAANLVK